MFLEPPGLVTIVTTYLVQNIEKRNVVVDSDSPFVVHQQVHDVGHGGRDPPSSLVVEFVEAFRAVRVGVAGRRVLNPVPSL
jgi:hypothetical protein